MREVAQHLEQIADALPQRPRERALLLRLSADRLHGAAMLLTAEVNAGDPRTTGMTAAVGRIAMLATGALLIPIVSGASDGVASAIAQKALEGQERSMTCLDDVEREASQSWTDLDVDLTQEIEHLRQLLLGIGIHPSSVVRSDAARTIVEANGLAAPDLGVPNRRQRLVYLKDTVERLRALAVEMDSPAGSMADLNDAEIRIADARKALEVVAAHDDSLYPPQPT